MSVRTTFLIAFVSFSAQGLNEIQGLVMKDKLGKISGLLLNPGTRREQFYALDFQATKLAQPQFLKNLKTPFKLKSCVDLKSSRVVSIAPLSPIERMKFYDRMPAEFTECKKKINRTNET